VPDAPSAGGAALPPAVRIDDPQAERGAGDGSFIEGRFGAGAAERSYKLYVPPGAGSPPMPMVVMLQRVRAMMS